MSSTCRNCGLPLGFKKNARGKMAPCNPDGSDHFDLCRQTQFQGAKTHGTFFKRKEPSQYRGGRPMIVEGYEYKGKVIRTAARYAEKGE